MSESASEGRLADSPFVRHAVLDAIRFSRTNPRRTGGCSIRPMKNIVPVILGIAAILCATATAIASANGWFVGRAYLVPRLFEVASALFVAALAVAIYNSQREQKLKPLVVPVRFGRSPVTDRHSLGHHGLIVVNHGEPAYDLSILTSEISVGSSKLKLAGGQSTFTKSDGAAFFAAHIEISPGSSLLGDGLFDEMRKQRVDSISVALIYKDAENRWYKTIGKIERDVSEPGGLSVKYVGQKRTRRP
jgi:hypothetical protein